AYLQHQQAVVTTVEILDPCLGAERRGQGGRAALLAFQQQAHAEAAAFAAAVAHQREIAWLEDPQPQPRARHQHGAQGKQWQDFGGHGPGSSAGQEAASRAARNRRGAPSKPPLDMNTTWSPALVRSVSADS